MDEVVVRQATPDDTTALAALRREFTYEDPPPGDIRPDYDEAFAEIIGKGLQDGSWIAWVAVSKGEIVGHAFVALVRKIPRPIEGARYIGYLTNVYVRPSHRGSGLGGRVLDTATKWAGDLGVELLIVWPSEDSVSLYRRHGFESGDEPLVWMNTDLPE